MKKKIHFLLLFVLACLPQLYGQNVNIPDVNFKNKLIALGIDTNSDGQIQVSEALVVTKLDVSSNGIVSLDGIEAFTNLDTLNCSNNNPWSLNITALINLRYLDCHSSSLSNLNISTLLNLQYLDCSGNDLTSLNVSPLIYLQKLNCLYNALTSLDVSSLAYLDSLVCSHNQFQSLTLGTISNLQYLDCSINYQLQSLDVSNLSNLLVLSCSDAPLLQSLDVNALTNLTHLYCYNSGLSSLDVSALTNLTNLYCAANNLTSLNVTNNINLVNLDCQNNQIPSLDVSAATNLQSLICYNNSLTNLYVNGLTNLQQLYCDNNLLTSLDLSGVTSLGSLGCDDNLLTNLDVSNCINLYQLGCRNNQLQTLDISNCIHLPDLYCENNQINTLFLKNGVSQYNLNFSNNPIQYICIDDFELGVIQQKVAQYGMNNVSVNSFCSFAPGGNGNIVSGQSTYDEDMNGCSVNDSAFKLLMIAVTDGVNTGCTYSNYAGNHTTYLDSGAYTFTPILQNSTYFSSNPISTTINFSNNNNNLQTQDFCIVPNGVFPDVEIVVIPLTHAAPGFTAKYQLYFYNKGTTTASGDITLDFMGNKMNVLNTSISPTTQNSNQLTWTYSNLNPLEFMTINVTMYILIPPINNAGDSLDFNTHISLLNDVDITNNDCMLRQDVLSGYDPNDKTCLEGRYLPNTKIGNYLHYLIRFQNTGNYFAQKVVVMDSIDSNQFDISSLQVMETSHPVQIGIANNAIEFYFDNIMLPDSFSNEPESHGYILFKIKPKNNLAYNSTVSNKAEIYFDYNLPVVTNTAHTTFYASCVLGFTSNATTQDISCNGICDGMISVNASGGTLPYVYVLNDNPTPATMNNLCAGTYIQTVLDSGGCFLTNTYTLSEPPAINIAINTISPILCYGDNSTVSATASSGVVPYSYNWGNGNTSNTTTLPAGNYSITVSDNNGCIRIESFTISQPTPLNAAINTIIGTVNNQNGEIQITVSGATAPYTYSWSNGQTSQNATQLSAGIYSVTITDVNGCDTTISNIAVTEIVGVDGIENILFNVYPNPSQTALSIESAEAVDLIIYNSLGEIVISKTVQGKENLDISTLPKGVYWIQQRNTHNGKTFVKE